MFRRIALDLSILVFFVLVCAAFVLLVGLGGCAHEQAVHQPATTPSWADEGQGAGGHGSPQATTTFEQGGEQPVTVTATTYQPIFFNFDAYDIRPDQRATVEANARAVPDGASLKLVGYCDERGSFDYNLALGERRALSVARALRARGVDGRRIAVVSLGKEKATGNDDAGWQADRRVEITPQ